MATFHAPKGYQFSEDGTDPWAVFTRIEGSDPVVFEFVTDEAKVIGRLKKIDDIKLVDDAKAKPEDPDQPKGSAEGNHGADPNADDTGKPADPKAADTGKGGAPA